MGKEHIESPAADSGAGLPQREQGGSFIGIGDKAKNKAEELAGKAKAAAGDATDNRDLEAEGRVQESKADVKQAGENLKDSGDDVADALRSASGATKFEDPDTQR